MIRIVVSASFRLQTFEARLMAALKRRRIPSQIEAVAEREPWVSLSDPHGRLHRNRGGINLLLVRVGDWAAGARQKSQQELPAFENEIASSIRKFEVALEQAASRQPVPYLICVCSTPERALAPGVVLKLEHVAREFVEGHKVPGVHVCLLARKTGRRNMASIRTASDESEMVFAELAPEIAAKIDSLCKMSIDKLFTTGGKLRTS